MDLKQGDLENIILNALWDLEGEGLEKIFVGHIQDKIKSPQKKWAYTTVKTVLDRLVDKDIALREKDGKKYLYRSVVDRDKAGVVALRKVLRQYFQNDSSSLIACLRQIDADDAAGKDIGDRAGSLTVPSGQQPVAARDTTGNGFHKTGLPSSIVASQATKERLESGQQESLQQPSVNQDSDSPLYTR